MKAIIIQIKRVNYSLTPNVPFYTLVRNFSQKENNSTAMFSSKETYIKSKWSVDFPTYDSLDYKDIAGLASRSRDIGIWFKQASDEFNLYKEAPGWFLNADKDASDWTQEVQNKYAYIKQLNKEHGSTINKISLAAKKQLKDAEAEHKRKLINELRDTPELVIELINSTMLPLETHIKSFEYSTKEEASEFIYKELLLYKERVYRKFISGELTIDELINILFVKH